MDHIFYFLSIFPIFYSIVILIKPRKFSILMTNIGKKNKDGLTDKEKEFIGFAAVILLIYGFFNIIWLFMGLFTSQWILFILLFILSFIVVNKFWFILWMKYVIVLPTLLFIIFNKYHFHINLPELLMNLFQTI